MFVAPARIVKAVQEGRWNKVKTLVYLVIHSFSGRALAIYESSATSGARTPGVDGTLWNTSKPSWPLSRLWSGPAIGRNRSAGSTFPRATASNVPWASPQ